MRSELQSVLDSIPGLNIADIPALLGELEHIRATAAIRLSNPTLRAPEHDELLGVETAANRLGVSKDYLYRHAAELPFTRRMGRKLLCSSQGIDDYLRRPRAKKYLL